MTRPCVVHLRDLAHRYMWNPRAIAPFLAAVGLDVERTPAWRAFRPPGTLVLVASVGDAALLAGSRPWLEQAARIVVVRDHTDAGDDADVDEAAWHDALAAFADVEVVDWRDHGDGGPCREAIARALARAAPARADEPVASAPAPESRDLELPASTWVEWTSERPYDALACIAAQLVVHDGRAALVDARGALVDLAAPTSPIVVGRADEGRVRGLPLASSEDRLTPCGFDPTHPVGWRGHRMAVYWSYVGARDVGFLSATDHDYPCGPAKKLWGYKDNDPVAVAVTPAADACAQRFEHDLLFTCNVPVAWHRAVDAHVDVAAFVDDPRRALFYAESEEWRGGEGSDDLLDEDNRDCPPAFVLGPGPSARYAVDLRYRVVRITGTHDVAVGVVLGGPGDGYAVFDDEHRLVRRGTGLLLGGWYRHATVEDGGALWREDLATGRRTLLGYADRVRCVDADAEAVAQDAIREGRHDEAARLRAGQPCIAIEGAVQVLAIPGTRNVLEITDRFLRVL